MGAKNVEDFYPLSPMQQGMLFHSLYAPESGAYIGQLSCTLRGDLDTSAFERAWQQVVSRHTILRTAFVVGDLKEPVQVVHRQISVPVQQQDWRGLSLDEQKNQLETFLQADQRQGFNPAEPPLLRLALLQLADDAYRFVWTYHHILFDGWSLPLLLQEVFAFYEAYHRSHYLTLPAPRPYRNYVAWLKKQNLGEAEAFWRQTLQGFSAPTPLVVDHLPDPVQGDNAPAVSAPRAELGLSLPTSTSAELQKLARQQHLTLNTLVQGAWALLLSRYSGEDDVVFGATVSGRPVNLPGAEHMIGLFINTLPVRMHLAPDAPVLDWLKEIQSQQVELRRYEYSPLVQIQGWSDVPRGAPMFESILVFENFPVASAVQERGEGGVLAIEDVQDVQQTNFPITLVAYPGEQLTLRIAYDTQRFESAVIERMLGHLRTLLENIAADPRQRLSGVSLLTDAERRQMIEWNNTAAPFPQDRCVHQLLEKQVECTPDADAVVFEGAWLSYRELNARANQLAHYLRGLGVGPETLVGLCVEPSLELVVGVLGVLKSGAAYLPLEPTYPAERLAFMLTDSQAPVLLTQAHLQDRLPGHSARVVCLDADWPAIAPVRDDNPASGVTPDNLAYVIYTSGSTGRPKGTLLQHRSLCNLAGVLVKWFDIRPDSRVLQFAAFSFDASVSEIVMALLAGATLVMASRDTLSSPPDLLALLRDEAITTVTLPPSLLAILPSDDLPALRTVVSAGESCSWDVAERWSPGRRFLNGYGPTETTVAASYYQVTQRVPGTTTVPIGRPIDNVQMYVLDAHRQPVPVGVSGELYIGGAGVARGYLGRPDLTAERFIENPFRKDEINPPSSLLYKTGDRVRYLPDGHMEFVGRIDDQVKIRGFRIELGEIEAALSQHASVRAAAVAVREPMPGDKRLVAYVMPVQVGSAPDDGSSNGAISPLELRAFLKQRLPEYMLPSAFVMLEALPLLPNGKVDRKALPALDGAWTDREHTYVAPRTPEEEILAGIWAQVLGVQRVGANDSFFELGGHSLLATQTLSRMRDAFQIDLPLRVMFETPTLSTLAQRIEQARSQAQGLRTPPLRAAARDGDLPLSFAQQRLWFFDQLEAGSPMYNLPSAVRLNGALDVAVLERSLNEIVRRHEILRTSIITVEGHPRQVIDESAAIALGVTDLSALPEADREAEVARRAVEEAQQPFDLARAPLMRAHLLRLDQTDTVGLFTMHHIISDGWSMAVMIRELAALYNAFANDLPSPLPELPLQYADYAVWQRNWLQGKTLDAQLNYWKQQLAGSPSLLELPTDRPRPAIQTFRGESINFAFPRSLSDRLRVLCQQSNTTMFMTLLAAFKVLLHRYSGQEDICVGTPIANRNWAETENLIGFFVNTLVLRSDLSGEPSFRDLLKRVREVALQAYAHQDLPFEMVVDAVQPERNLSYTPLFQVMFALQNTPLRAEALTGLSLSAVDAHSGTAKFDLTLEIVEGADGLAGSFEYNTDLFDAATIQRMIGHFQILLNGVVDQPDQPISRLPLLTEAEQDQLLIEWNNTAADYPLDRCAHELFETQVERAPEAVAVTFESEQLTYLELNRRANQLAHHLKKMGVGPEVPVGICVERSPEMIVGVVGILKAGGAYVPMDPTYPVERLTFMLEDCRAPVMLTQARYASSFTSRASQRVICLDSDWPVIARECDENPHSGVMSGNLAYVIYTSGSTGEPKGVEIEHKGLLNLTFWHRRAFAISPADRATQIAGQGFDASVWEVWPYLTAGASLHIPNDETRSSPLHLRDWLISKAITVSFVPTPLTDAVLALDWPGDLALRTLLTGGDRLHHYPSRSIPFTLVNNYGPTEDTVVATSGVVPPEGLSDMPPSIGRPIDNTQIYVLDACLQPVPLGVAGELYIGGAGLARGYLNRPELTAERFVENPFRMDEAGSPSSPALARRGVALHPSSLLYKTGDLVRYRPDGSLEFSGRIDHQVKIRGFRIELGEIEAVLGQHPALREAAVLAREDVPGEKRLVAYIVPQPRDERPKTEDEGSSSLINKLRAFLKAKLPDHMVPSAFVTLEALPITPNGKVDRRALPAPDQTRPEGANAYVAPRTPAEESLAGIWAHVLGVKQVGIQDNFFELGGDSILSIQVIARANQAGLRLTPRQFFQHPTVEGLAAVAGAPEVSQVEQGLIVGSVPLTPIQHWFFEHHPLGPHHWNTSIMLEVWTRLDPAVLKESIKHLLAHHDALRLRFELPDPNTQSSHQDIRQFNAALDDAVPVSFIDLSAIPPEKHRTAIETSAAQVQASLNLSQGPLFRVTYFDRGPEQSGRLLIVFHHLVTDGVSLRILLEDFQRAYRQISGGESVQFPAKTSSFQTWAKRLVKYAQPEELRQELSYWEQMGQETFPSLPTDYPDGTNTYGQTARVVVSLEASETRALLQAVPAAYGAQIYEALLAGLVESLSRWTGRRAMLVELEGHGREDMFFDEVNVSRTIGWFTSMFPVVLDLESARDPLESLAAIRGQLRAIPNRGIGYGLLRYLCQDEAVRSRMSRLPAPEVNFNYLGQFDQTPIESIPFSIAPESVGPEQHPHGRRSALIYVVGIITGGSLDIQWSYSTGAHRRETIQGMADAYVEELRRLIARCAT